MNQCDPRGPRQHTVVLWALGAKRVAPRAPGACSSVAESHRHARGELAGFPRYHTQNIAVPER